jgi:Uma2 family endonuclease
MNIASPGVPPLRDGERLTQAEFHRRYKACPRHFKAELIGGIVYVASPVGDPHGTFHAELSGLLWYYKVGTPGTRLSDNTTTILGKRSEPQPDLALRILPEFGGQSRLNERQYVEGPPELVAEVAHSSRDIDLGPKRNDYQRAGVLEYLVLCVGDEDVQWFDFRRQRALKPNRQGIIRSRIFPGLWLDTAALWAGDSARLIAVVQQGLASRPHAAFVKRLEAARRRRP